MPVEMVREFEPYGSLGIIESQEAVVFRERGAPGGRSRRVSSVPRYEKRKKKQRPHAEEDELRSRVLTGGLGDHYS